MTELTADNLTIDPEFQELIPSPSADEVEQLERNILADGAIWDPIKVWAGIVIDGHNRLRIYREHQDELLPPDIVEMEFDSRSEAIDWAIDNQLGRRNLPEAQRSYLRGKKYNVEKTVVRNPKGRNQHETAVSEVSAQNEHKPPQPTTADKIAASQGVSAATVRRDGEYAQAIDRIAAINSKAADDIRAGVLKLPKCDVIEVGKLGADEIGKALRNVREGRKWNNRSAARSHTSTSFTGPTDELGLTVPDDLLEQHAMVKTIRGIVQSIGKFKKPVQALDGAPGANFVRVDRAIRSLTQAQNELKHATMYTHCPECDRNGGPCETCRGAGFIPKSMWKGGLSDLTRKKLGC